MEDKEKIIERLRKVLMLKYPRFAGDIASKKIVFSNNIMYDSLAMTDSEKIYLNERTFPTLSPNQQLFIVAHEYMHVKFEHVRRLMDKDGKYRDPAIWNIATDAIINANLVQDGLEMVEGGIDIEESINYSAEEFYDHLIEEAEKELQKQQEQEDDENESAQGEPTSNESDNNNTGTKESSAKQESEGQSNGLNDSSSQDSNNPQNEQPDNESQSQANASKLDANTDLQSDSQASNIPDQNSQTSSTKQDSQSTSKDGTSTTNSTNNAKKQNPLNNKFDESANAKEIDTADSSGQDDSGESLPPSIDSPHTKSQPGNASSFNDESSKSQDKNKNDNSRNNNADSNDTQEETSNQETKTSQNGKEHSSAENHLKDDANLKNENKSQQSQNNSHTEKQNQESDNSKRKDSNSPTFGENNTKSQSETISQQASEQQNAGKSKADNNSQRNNSTNEAKQVGTSQDNLDSNNEELSEPERDEHLKKLEEIIRNKYGSKTIDDHSAWKDIAQNLLNQASEELDNKSSKTNQQENAEHGQEKDNLESATKTPKSNSIGNKEDSKAPVSKNDNKEHNQSPKSQNDKDSKENSQDSQNPLEKDEFEKNRKQRIDFAKKHFESLKRGFSSNMKSPQQAKLKVSGIDNKTIDWRLLIRRQLEKEEIIWSQRRSIAENNYAYRLEDYEDEHSVTQVMIDSSGSVKLDEVKAFLRMLKPLLKDSEMFVGCFDTQFYGFLKIKNERDIENFDLIGRGGTNFDNAIVNFSTDPKVNKIVFTDGYCTQTISEKYLYNIIWIVYGNKDFVPSCGKVVNIKLDSLIYKHDADEEELKM